MTLGKIDSFGEMVVKRKLYLGLVPIFLSPIGLINKRNIGWIFTASLFYLIAILGVGAMIRSGIREIQTVFLYVGFMAFLISPILLMNDKDFKRFYHVDISDRLIFENVVTLIAMVVDGCVIIWIYKP